MSDKRKFNGGHPTNGGRPSKAEEQKLIENLTPMNPIALSALEEGLTERKEWAVKLFFNYFYGMPKQTVENNTNLNVQDFDISKLYDPKKA